MGAPGKLRQIATFIGLALPIAVAVHSGRDDAMAHADTIDVAKKVAVATIDSAWRLPWSAGATQYLTQDANDDCCGDHVGVNKNAYDFAAWDGSAFDVVAPAAGTVVHVKMSSKHGCGDSSCVNDANYVVIDHGDGTQTTLLHLAYGSLDPSIQCGTFVRRGQRLAVTGSTGWSTGVHLHVERDQVKKNLKEICECGENGMGCTQSAAKWNLFWPSATQPNVPTKFAEWGAADAPGNRRGLIGPSKNVDEKEEVVSLGLDRLGTTVGDWVEQKSGGQKGSFRYAKADGKATATYSLKGAVTKPGVYEVWAWVPLAPAIGATETTVSLKTAKGTTKGALDTHNVGGSFHRVKGLEQVVLTGGEDSLVFSSAQAVEGKVVVADGVVLRRVAPYVEPAAKVAKTP
ncbi:MAG: M23 family metallopeptidase [Polyangiales bacterium]